MNRRIKFETDRLSLAYLDPSCAAELCEYLKSNREHFQNSRALYPDNYFTPEKQGLILQQEVQRRSEGKAFRFYIFIKGREQIIGDLHFNELVRGAFQSCYVGYKMSEENTGKGLMTEALNGAAAFMFEEYKLHRIEANIMPRNLASLRVVEKAGFHKEGLALRFLKINGTWEDHFRFALLNDAI